jgi:hypothetical protein
VGWQVHLETVSLGPRTGLRQEARQKRRRRLAGAAEGDWQRRRGLAPAAARARQASRMLRSTNRRDIVTFCVSTPMKWSTNENPSWRHGLCQAPDLRLNTSTGGAECQDWRHAELPEQISPTACQGVNVRRLEPSRSPVGVPAFSGRRLTNPAARRIFREHCAAHESRPYGSQARHRQRREDE